MQTLKTFVESQKHIKNLLLVRIGLFKYLILIGINALTHKITHERKKFRCFLTLSGGLLIFVPAIGWEPGKAPAHGRLYPQGLPVFLYPCLTFKKSPDLFVSSLLFLRYSLAIPSL